jgi:uncharacterized RDD family membrane protein YckC
MEKKNNKPVKNEEEWSFGINEKELPQMPTINNSDFDQEEVTERPQKLKIEATGVRHSTRTSMYNEMLAQQKENTEDVIVSAPVVKRGIALILDLFLMLGISYVAINLIPITKLLISFPMDKYKFVWRLSDKNLSYLMMGINSLVMYFFLVFFPTLFYNTSFGKRIMNLRVRGIDQYTLSFEQAFFRDFLFRPVSILSGVGLIVPFFNKEKKSLHDFLTKTQVVED